MKARFRHWRQWDDKAQQRLGEIQLLLASNPLQKAAATRASADRIKSLRDRLDAQYAKLDDSTLDTLRKSREEVTNAETAHALASQSEFGSGYLLGTGSEAWRLLWEAARRYSMLEAYPEITFPNTSKDAVCILCQTPLDIAASARLMAFETYVKNETLKLLQEKHAALKSHTEALDSITNLEPDYIALDSDIVELPEAKREQLAACVSDLWKRRNALVTFANTGEASEVPTMPANVSQILFDAETMKRSCADSEAALHDPIARSVLQKEGFELEDGHWLHTNGTIVQDQIGRLKALARLNAAQGDTNTTQVTTKATALNQAIVTQALCTAFQDEVKALGLRTITVELRSAGGQKGTLRFGVRLLGLDTNVVGKVASEGEKRCIAFALFMAELSQTNDVSSLVLDDPVSSLDHLHCEQMAKRIAREATKRQIVVFTHNPLFLHELQTGAEESGAVLHLGYLQWNGDTPGEWVSGLPWDWKSVQDRFHHLKQMQQKLEKKRQPSDVGGGQATRKKRLQLTSQYLGTHRRNEDFRWCRDPLQQLCKC